MTLIGGLVDLPDRAGQSVVCYQGVSLQSQIGCFVPLPIVS